MEQPAKSDPSESKYGSLVISFVVIAGIGLTLAFSFSQGNGLNDWHTYVTIAAVIIVAGLVAFSWTFARGSGLPADEAQARQRVRKAEYDLAESLRAMGEDTARMSARAARVEIDSETSDVALEPPEAEVVRAVEQLAIERRDERLTLAALWELTHGRLDLYHQIVTNQARRSFGAAQAAIIIGFVLLVAFAVLAVRAKITTAAISAGGLGAVGAAFSAYIGRTFIRSQESAASHLRAYFDQPLELSRYLAAERLLADADLTPEQRAAILSTLVQA